MTGGTELLTLISYLFQHSVLILAVIPPTSAYIVTASNSMSLIWVEMFHMWSRLEIHIVPTNRGFIAFAITSAMSSMVNTIERCSSQQLLCLDRVSTKVALCGSCTESLLLSVSFSLITAQILSPLSQSPERPWQVIVPMLCQLVTILDRIVM